MFFYKKAESPVAKCRITGGQETGWGGLPRPEVFGKASPQIRAGGGPEGRQSPPATGDCHRNGIWAPPPTRPPNIQVFENREGSQLMSLKN